MHIKNSVENPDSLQDSPPPSHLSGLASKYSQPVQKQKTPAESTDIISKSLLKEGECSQAEVSWEMAGQLMQENITTL